MNAGPTITKSKVTLSHAQLADHGQGFSSQGLQIKNAIVAIIKDVAFLLLHIAKYNGQHPKIPQLFERVLLQSWLLY